MHLWITPYQGKAPHIHPEAFVDVSVRIIGDVRIEDGASIWPMAVLRADSDRILISRRAAVLDLALLEAPEGHPVVLEEEALVSHGAKVHGAVIRSRALVGIGAIVLDGAEIASGCLIGSGALIPPGTRIPPNSLVLGVPGKVVRETTPQERENIRRQIEELYIKSRHLLSSS
jgi:carbonic anhydrase/acetyltransferase-like protein (isoleucine patch superfamily)